MGRRRRKKIPQGLFNAEIESLSHEGRGVAHIDGKTVFIDNALTGEKLEFSYSGRRSKFDEGIAEKILEPSEQRIKPECDYFGYCGGCSLQHIKPGSQIQHKQSVLLEQFQHLGKVEPETVLPALTGPGYGYRHKARLAVKHVIKKEKVLVGFREKRSPFVADITECKVLHPAIGERLQVLQALIEKLSIKNQIPQIEVAVSDAGTALVFRHLEAFSDEDLEQLKHFEREFGFKLFLQPNGYDSVHRLIDTDNSELYYELNEHDLRIYFQATDFTQINVDINKAMINLALQLLETDKEDEVLDLFCGVGNFTLPIARQVKSVMGIEGDATLVSRARDNAIRNKIDNAEFNVADLFEVEQPYPFMNQEYNKILLDPARTGAKEILSVINLNKTKRIVYVSCNPATLARDAGILVHERGFTLKQAGVMDMFPHTSHVESIALFTR